jgi:hypothetical protein
MKKFFSDLINIPHRLIPTIVENNSSYAYTDSIVDCDYVLLPYWQYLYEYTDGQYRSSNLDPSKRKDFIAITNQLISLAKQYNKKIIVVNWSDSDVDIPIENALIFKTSVHRSRNASHVLSFPSWVNVTENLKNAVPRQKSPKPKVGFRGSARPLQPDMEDIIRSGIGLSNAVFQKLNISFRLPHEWNLGQRLRWKAAKVLMRNQDIEADITILTRGYISQKDPHKRELNRKLFNENIINNDYILCVRGAGNYSYRFYETLVTGRIPLFINTDCALPFDFILNWKKYLVWVEENEIDRIDDILLDFHHSLTNDEFVELQINIRRLWNEWICMEAFYKNFDECLLYFENECQMTTKNV